MAFPYTTIADFEGGTFASTHFDTETDTNGGLDFPHYTDLARYPLLSMPYRGAYCSRFDMATISTAGAWMQETGSWDMTAGTEDMYLRIKFWLSKDAVMSSDDVFSLIEFWSSTNTAEACAAVKYTTAAGWEVGIGDAAVPTSLKPLTLGEWHDLEVYIDPAGGGAGTIDGWLDGVAFTQVGSLTHANITSGIVGANPGAAFTPTAGTLLIDQIIGHQTDNTSARIGSGGQRFPAQLQIIKSGHAFVGHGIIDNASLLSGAAADNVLQLWDTDEADTTNGTMKLELKNLTASETPVDPAGVPVEFTKGCYVSLSGTNPRAMLNIRRAMGYSSDGAIRTVASRRIGQPA